MSCGCSSGCGGNERDLNSKDLALEAELRLQEHIAQHAVRCLELHGELSRENIELFLLDSDCVRYPTSLVYDNSALEDYQFAQPEWDGKDPDNPSYRIFLHESLKQDSLGTLLAVSYVIPLINYGEVIEDKHCAIYGSAITGLSLQRYVDSILEMAKGLSLRVA